MKFEDIIAEFGKPLHELTDEEVIAIATKLDAPELERFEAHVKMETKKPRTQKVSKGAKEAINEYDKLLLQGKKT
jgi:hypothetical protein